ncbi:hypothetical protein I2483_13915 [Sporosarcina sp. E16_3]|uniref:hypothetical protein n=1 Tax=Sporosarcina sp. E16_3 TaxID=2789293 RepID=UPI001A90DFE8|nr:hypothetical protein [Sporosarcina sp. E16_3]MBO0602760.1 hypothetical protein [Sporosarcina sp. E16_3]
MANSTKLLVVSEKQAKALRILTEHYETLKPLDELTSDEILQAVTRGYETEESK